MREKEKPGGSFSSEPPAGESCRAFPRGAPPGCLPITREVTPFPRQWAGGGVSTGFRLRPPAPDSQERVSGLSISIIEGGSFLVNGRWIEIASGTEGSRHTPMDFSDESDVRTPKTPVIIPGDYAPEFPI